ncbi:helix-turn-helix transcriptional regulator [Williamsia sterculiae]|uniref:Helix-turn-helix domain-containing protein n=1 Tax=Williamsia sterculiae TaxID=1344003 RepID=A0A1N7ENN3_9NOCA|nr:helix-turn-helix transcriptional regulator [Williamsia sterculiae]SIR89525.1 Helix-turn-helix domain-containing protein [Williamsia sterculiae]
MTNAHDTEQLSGFLRSRRAAADPSALGAPGLGLRRVPGLRREELAEAAGVSLTYYTRLEQGLATNPSSQVLDAIARALRLDDVERAHLQRVAVGHAAPAQSARPRLRTDIATLLDRMTDVAAMAMSPSQEIVGWNRLGHALMASHLDPMAPYGDHPPNKVALLFTDPASRSLYREWEYEAVLAVASLRYVGAVHASREDLQRLVGELSVASDDFARLWAEHPVVLCTHGTKLYHHPAVGRIDLHFEVLHLPEGDGHFLLLQYAEPGSSSDHAMSLLASSTITG